MIYVTSDLHGYPLAEFKKLLERANFSEDDFLYILGDVIDRHGDGGVEMLRWLIKQPNIELILGNHEAMLLSCDFLFKEITMESIENLSTDNMKLLLNYLSNGGNETLKSLRALMDESPKEVHEILDYLRYAPLYETITVGENDFILVHGGLGNFSPDKKLSEYTADELLWTSPDLNERYFDDITVVLGHTPTMTYHEMFNHKILRTKTWIDIDVGAGYGNAPVLFNLDTMDEMTKNKKSIVFNEKLCSGILKMDADVNCLQRPECFAIAGQKESGKTALALRYALNTVLSTDKEVFYYSLKEPEPKLIEKLNLTPYCFNEYGIAKEQKKRVHFAYENNFNISKVYESLNENKKIGLIIVDHMEIESTKQSETQKLCEELSKITTEFQIPVIILLNISNEDYNYSIYEFRDEIKKFESDFSIIAFLEKEETDITKLILDKNQAGPLDDYYVKLVYEKKRKSNA